MEELILELIYFLKDFSYAGIIVALTFEFVPAELVLPLAGYWVYSDSDSFRLIPTILAGTVGGTFGPLTLYAIGRFGGRPFIKRFGKYLFIGEKHLVASDRFFEKYGGSVAFFGRFLPGVRTLISIPCGIAKMNVFVFSLYTFLAMLPITSLYVYLGYRLGANWENVASIVSQNSKPFILGLCLILAAYIFYKVRSAKRLKKAQ